MGYSKKDVRTLDNTSGNTKLTSIKLDGTTTEEVIVLGEVASKITLQASGSLTVNATFSLNGVDYFDTTAVSTTPATYTTHAVTHIKLTRTASEGLVYIAAVQ